MKNKKAILGVVLVLLGIIAVGVGAYFLWHINRYIVMLLVGIAGGVVAGRTTFAGKPGKKGFGITGLVLSGMLIILSVVALIKGWA